MIFGTSPEAEKRKPLIISVRMDARVSELVGVAAPDGGA
jgi:hypothetical protein